MTKLIDFSNYKSILCLDGALPNTLFFRCHLPIIAADGAANTLMQMGIRPDIVICDLDSISAPLRHQLPSLHFPDQNYCDFEKCLDYLEKKQWLPTIITGINGGYLDHVLNNVNLFLHTKNLCYAPPLIGLSIQENESKEFVLPTNTKLSVLGIPSAIISSQGLRWELDHYALAFPGKTSCFNRTVSSVIRLTVHHGSVFLLIY